MTSQEIIGFLSVAIISSIIAYLIKRFKDESFWWPLCFWTLATFSWFIYIKANPDNTLWFTDFENMGTLSAFAGVLFLGLFYALQSVTMFDITYEYCDRQESDSFMLIPISAMGAGILLIFISLGYLSSQWLWIPVSIAVGCVIIAFILDFFDWDVHDFLYKILPLFLTLAVISAFVYTFPMLAESSAFIFAIIFFVIGLKYSTFLEYLGTRPFFSKPSKGKTSSSSTEVEPPRCYSSSSYSKDRYSRDYEYESRPRKRVTAEESSSRSYASSSYSDKPSSVSSSSRAESSPMMVVTFKGRYYMNGPKLINKVITCSVDESRTYTTYMYDKATQKAWIQANYPGADLNRDWALNVNIKKK